MLTSGDVVDVDLGVSMGSEAGFPRPVVVVTAQLILDQQPSVIQVVPLTSTIRNFRTEVTIEPAHSGLTQLSAAQCQHIRSISTSRIGLPRGNVGTVNLRSIREILVLLMDLD
jgi:mRNA interferase MazF